MNFMKYKFPNWVTANLNLMIRMYGQQFHTMQNVPIYATIHEWVNGKFWYGEKH
jgi:hypothetical protein